MKSKNNKDLSVPLNPELLGIITPIGMNFKNNALTIGEYMSKTYAVIQYPQKAEFGWLGRLTNISSTIAAISFKPIDSSVFIDSLSRSITLNKGNAQSAKDPLTAQRAERAALDAEKIMTQIDSEGESVGLMSIVVLPMARAEEEFEKLNRKLQGIFALSKCKIRTMSSLQKQCYQIASPAYGLNEAVEEIAGRVMPLSTFTGGFPFASTGFNDGNGYYLGKNAAGGLVILDSWKRGGDRTNSNMTILGIAGVGKSTAVKHIALSEYMKGTKIIFIDIEREYKELTENLNGDWINCGGGRGGMLNPLQIRPSPKDDGEEGLSDMALYLKILDIFFSLYLSELDDIKKALLKDALIELYEIYGITWDTDISSLESEEFPTFSDLYDLIEIKAEETQNENYNDLLLLLKDIAKGSDSFLWNGKTSIDLSSRCICFDTHDLQNTSDNVKKTQYFNLLSYCWQLMSENRNEKVLLIADEAYIMIDPKVPQSLVFLRNVEKRARKYEAAVAVISHSVVDFLSPEIKLYGQALLDIPCVKILMGTDGANLKETKELYHLTKAEEELLASKRRGQALVMIGSKRMSVNFELPEYKIKWIGSGGGR